MHEMKDVERVADDFYFVKHRYEGRVIKVGWFCGVSVILGATNIGLVDTGLENTLIDYVFPFIRELGRDLVDIDYVVNTHRDRDHVSGNAAIRERTKAKIAIHELDAKAVEIIDDELKDGDVVALGIRRFRVVHIPGHRPGSICLYDQVNGVLISGDSVCGGRTDLIRMDKDIYINSLKKLLDLEIRALVMSHPFPPMGKSILAGNETKEMIRESISIAEKLNQS